MLLMVVQLVCCFYVRLSFKFQPVKNISLLLKWPGVKSGLTSDYQINTLHTNKIQNHIWEISLWIKICIFRTINPLHLNAQQNTLRDCTSHACVTLICTACWLSQSWLVHASMDFLLGVVHLSFSYHFHIGSWSHLRHSWV